MAEPSIQALILPSQEAVAVAAPIFTESHCVFVNGSIPPELLNGRDDYIVTAADSAWVDTIVGLLKDSGGKRIRWGYEAIESVSAPHLAWIRRVISGNEYKAPAPQVQKPADPVDPPDAATKAQPEPAAAGLPAGSPDEPPEEPAGSDWGEFPPVEAYAQDAAEESALRGQRNASALKREAHEPEGEWPEPVDHFTDYPIPAFDPEWLPPNIRQFVTNIAAQQGCDVGMPGLHAITMAAICISDDIKISVKPNQSWHEPPCLWSCVVSPSGHGKTPSLTAITRGITDLTVEIAERSKRAFDTYRRDNDVYQAQYKSWVAAKAKGDPCGLPPIAPDRPVDEQLFFDDFTVEGIADVLQQSSRGSSCVVDELLGLFASFNRYRPGNDRQFFLQSWSGGKRVFNRAGGRKWIINDCTLSMLGNSQPAAIQAAVKKDGLESDGLIQRVLVYHALRDENEQEIPSDIEAARAWKSLCEKLYYLKTHLDHCYFSRDAQDIFRDWEYWVKDHRAQLPTDAAKEALSKWRGYAARIALVYHCIESVSSGRDVVAAEVSEETLSRVVAFLRDGLYPHLVKFYAETIGGQSGRTNAVRQIATWIVCRHGLTPEITLRDIAQNCQGAWYPEGAESYVEARRKALITELTTHSGWLKPAAQGKIGQLPTRYTVNPRVDSLYAAMRAELAPARAAKHDRFDSRGRRRDS